MISHAKEVAPIEACGYLAEKNGEVVAFYKMTNVDASADHYTLDPKEQFSRVKEIRSAGMELCAVYHSHPVSPARPSQEDIRLAYDPSLSYVIVSLADQGEVVNSFRIKNVIVESEEIEIVKDGNR